MAIAIKSIDQLNFLLVIAACIFAHVMPIEALVLSYAFLGPAHYLTEISWLHDRQYFTKGKHDYIMIISLGICALILADPQKTALMFLFFFAIAMAFTPKWHYRLLAACLATALFILLNTTTLSVYFFLLLPTLVHVFLFTFFFVMLGALRNGSGYGYLTLFAMILCGASFFIDVIPIGTSTEYGTDNMVYMESIYTRFADFIGVDPSNITTQKVFGFVGFAYTYHYLNWFSKTRIIGWNEISRMRLYSLIVMYVGAISLYAYDYESGLAALFLLSFLHVILEFPLNGISMLQIGQQLKKRLAPNS